MTESEMKRIIQNLDLKVWALVIAIVLWFHVTTEKTYEESFEIPLIIPPPEGLVQVNPLPNPITFTLKGKGKDLLKLKWFSSLKASVKLPKVKRGKVNLPLTKNNIRLSPHGVVEIVAIDPPAVLLDYDRPEAKKIKISPHIVGTPREGFLWTGEVDFSSPTVTFWGGRRKVRSIDSLLTETVDLTNRDESFEKKVAILLPPGEGFRIAPDSVTLTIILEEVVERAFTEITVRLLNKPRRWNVVFDPEKGEIILAGPKSIIEEIRDEDLIITLNLKGKKKGEFEISPSFHPPSGISVVSTDPELFKVTLE